MPNILILKVQPNINKEQVDIINSYNALIKSKPIGGSVDIIIKILELLYKHVLIIGDFNLYHTNWDNYIMNLIV